MNITELLYSIVWWVLVLLFAPFILSFANSAVEYFILFLGVLVALCIPLAVTTKL